MEYKIYFNNYKQFRQTNHIVQYYSLISQTYIFIKLLFVYLQFHSIFLILFKCINKHEQVSKNSMKLPFNCSIINRCFGAYFLSHELMSQAKYLEKQTMANEQDSIWSKILINLQAVSNQYISFDSTSIPESGNKIRLFFHEVPILAFFAICLYFDFSLKNITKLFMQKNNLNQNFSPFINQILPEDFLDCSILAQSNPIQAQGNLDLDVYQQHNANGHQKRQQNRQEKWTQSEELQFYKYFGNIIYFQTAPDITNNDYFNKKGILTELGIKIPTKTATQIKSKFQNLKRFTKNNYKMRTIQGMRQAILSILRKYQNNDQQCCELIQKIQLHNRKLIELDKMLTEEIQKNQQDNQQLKLILNDIIQISNKRQKPAQKIVEKKSNRKKVGKIKKQQANQLQKMVFPLKIQPKKQEPNNQKRQH